VQRRLKTDPGFYAPRTAVLCPCRGVEPGLERNLVSLCEFDHQNYEVFFVLASEADPAYGTGIAKGLGLDINAVVAKKQASAAD